ncbi:MAG: TM2 domain-containing protein [Planctomycetes bacterium]|nr:TM2 domain-containing protein [Planctomycetota bacterium]
MCFKEALMAACRRPGQLILLTLAALYVPFIGPLALVAHCLNMHTDSSSRPADPNNRRELAIARGLWLCLGVAGAHKWYLGRRGMAWLYLLTMGMFGIGWLVDGFTLKRQVNAANDRAGTTTGSDLHSTRYAGSGL